MAQKIGRVAATVVWGLAVSGFAGTPASGPAADIREGTQSLGQVLRATGDLFDVCDVQVMDIASEHTLGGISPSPLGTFRDEVISIDATNGRLAVLEWSHRESTLKIVKVQPWSVTTRTIPIGRFDGLGGSVYDFAQQRFIGNVNGEIRVIDSNGASRRYPIASRRDGYAWSSMMLVPGGLLMGSWRSEGDYMGYAIHRLKLDTGTLEELYWSGGARWAMDVADQQVRLAEVLPGQSDSRAIVSLNLANGERTTHRFDWPGWHFAFTANTLLALGGDKPVLRCIDLQAPNKARDLPLSIPGGFTKYNVTAAGGYALVMLQEEKWGERKLLRISLDTGQQKLMGINRRLGHMQGVSFGGKACVVLSE